VLAYEFSVNNSLRESENFAEYIDNEVSQVKSMIDEIVDIENTEE
jgi:mannitol-1-phosphate/altronate dehydrogenase